MKVKRVVEPANGHFNPFFQFVVYFSVGLSQCSHISLLLLWIIINPRIEQKPITPAHLCMYVCIFVFACSTQRERLWVYISR